MFSEKYGYRQVKSIQFEMISENLRNRIWNLFYINEIKSGGLSSKRIIQSINGEQTLEEKIADRLGCIIETREGTSILDLLRDNILEHYEWYDVLDFVDVHISFLSDEQRMQRCGQYNALFEQEKFGYRLVNGEIAPITNKVEIQSIEEATATPYLSVNQHITKALGLYADIKEPDYENSIKESISAVEAMCCIITGMTGSQATLGNSIKKLKDKGVHIHNAMEKAFLALYGYASNESGIRHGGIDFTNAPAEDAKYMLISCSTFVNYLVEKWSKINPKG